MTDNELLLAISNIVQSQVEPLKKDIQQIRINLENDIQQTRINLENDIQQTRISLEKDIQQTRIILENDILPRLQNIESCYTSTFNRYSSGINQLEAIQSDIDILKKVVTEHSERLQKIS